MCKWEQLYHVFNRIKNITIVIKEGKRRLNRGLTGCLPPSFSFTTAIKKFYHVCGKKMHHSKFILPIYIYDRRIFDGIKFQECTLYTEILETYTVCWYALIETPMQYALTCTQSQQPHKCSSLPPGWITGWFIMQAADLWCNLVQGGRASHTKRQKDQHWPLVSRSACQQTLSRIPEGGRLN